MGDISPPAFICLGLCLVFLLALISPIWLPVAVPALLLFSVYYVINRFRRTNISANEFVELTAAVAACAVLPWFSGYLTATLALVAVIDQAAKLIRRAVDFVWHVTLMQAALMTTRTAVAQRHAPDRRPWGWTIRLARLIWWNEKALYITEERKTDLRSLSLTALFLVSIPFLALFEVLTAFSFLGATALWSALLPVSAAVLDNGKTAKWAAITFTSVGGSIYVVAIFMVSVVIPALRGKLIKACRRRDGISESERERQLHREKALLKKNNFNADSALAVMACGADNCHEAGTVDYFMQWELEENHSPDVATYCLTATIVKDRKNQENYADLAQDLALGQRELIECSLIKGRESENVIPVEEGDSESSVTGGDRV